MDLYRRVQRRQLLRTWTGVCRVGSCSVVATPPACATRLHRRLPPAMMTFLTALPPAAREEGEAARAGWQAAAV